MKVYWELPEVGVLSRSVVTVGMFDGVHRGHRILVEEACSWADEIDGASVVLTFSNQSRMVTGREPVLEISSLRQRISLIGDIGVDVCVVLEFSNEMISMEPDDFIETVIRKGLSCEHLVAGLDWRFGRERRGGRELLVGLDQEGLLHVRFKEALTWNGEVISSTAIRESIQGGDLERVSGMLGRAFSLQGKVVSGSGRGRSLGFPTANLDIEGRARPPDGVYASIAAVDGRSYLSVTSVGAGPTFGGDADAVEVHAFDFDGDLYGRDMQVEFVRFLRSQEKFDGERELIEQIKKDVEEANRVLEGGGELP